MHICCVKLVLIIVNCKDIHWMTTCIYIYFLYVRTRGPIHGRARWCDQFSNLKPKIYMLFSLPWWILVQTLASYQNKIRNLRSNMLLCSGQHQNVNCFWEDAPLYHMTIWFLIAWVGWTNPDASSRIAEMSFRFLYVFVLFVSGVFNDLRNLPFPVKKLRGNCERGLINPIPIGRFE